MPRGRRASNVKRTPSEPPTANPSATRPTRSPVDQGIVLWGEFARETGRTATEFLRRFSEEQQRTYSSWIEAASRSPHPSTEEKRAAESPSDLEEWGRRTEEITSSLRDVVRASLGPSWEIAELWMRPFLPQVPRTSKASERTGGSSAGSTVGPSTPSSSGRRWIEEHI